MLFRSTLTANASSTVQIMAQDISGTSAVFLNRDVTVSNLKVSILSPLSTLSFDLLGPGKLILQETLSVSLSSIRSPDHATALGLIDGSRLISGNIFDLSVGEGYLNLEGGLQYNSSSVKVPLYTIVAGVLSLPAFNLTNPLNYTQLILPSRAAPFTVKVSVATWGASPSELLYPVTSDTFDSLSFIDINDTRLMEGSKILAGDGTELIVSFKSLLNRTRGLSGSLSLHSNSPPVSNDTSCDLTCSPACSCCVPVRSFVSEIGRAHV